ncbi:hypothetical protein [Flavobacterium daejeonense]|uniref:hypothetical protein n=1 Tax=Flavobacterium daejeonense TaxID=350893 RepID=UPI0006892AB7|nr:hypothetical protein [Flavobacterium daejeonense]
MSSFLGRSDLARGVRNNNPGNLIYTSIAWQGKLALSQNTDKKFEQFKEMKFGIRALILDIFNDIKKGKNTVRKLITEFAPPKENNTEAYINAVAKGAGISSDAVFKVVDFDLIYSIVKAIIKHENGADSAKVLDSDILDAFDLVDIKELNGVVVNLKKGRKFNIILVPVLLFFYTVLSLTV